MTIDRAPKLAIVAATYKRPEALATLLGSLLSQRLGPDAFEVCIVVDGIDEYEHEYRRLLAQTKASSQFRLTYAFQPNSGQSVARNRAIGLTSAPWLCIVDDDMELASTFLGAHLEALQSGGKGTVVIGRVVPEVGWEQQPLYEALRTKAMLRMHDELEAGQRSPEPADFVTQNVSLSRHLYREVGMLDERLRLGEDTELGFRLQFAGARFVFGPRASAVHRSRIGSYEGWLSRQMQYGRTSLQIYEKLGRHPAAHPLRNLVTGDTLKSLAVHATCWSDPLAHATIGVLRSLGVGLHRLGLVAPAIATHHAIMAVAYHLGVKETLGSWRAVLDEERSFAITPGRPLHPS